MIKKTGIIIKQVEITTDYIKLDQFLKWAAIAASGGEAKMLIEEQQVLVNKRIETVKGRKLYDGDLVELLDCGVWRVKKNADPKSAN